MWKTFALLSAFFAALTTVFAKLGLKNVNTDLATAIRTSIVLVLTWCIVLFGGRIKEIQDFSAPNWLFLVLSGIATGFSWLFYYRALKEGDLSTVSAIDKSSLLFVMLLSFLFLHQSLSLKILLGSLLIFAGSLVLVL
ncbi:MAG TPA: EamA family transporter [Bacteroidia bacterium]|nr:EamA family transporter [Bacteroidia bacterium]